MKIFGTRGEDKSPVNIELAWDDVELHDTFNGVTFVTETGERLSVTMRDSGFEVHYYRVYDRPHICLGRCGDFDAGWFRFNGGVVNDNTPELDAANTPEARIAKNRLRGDAWHTATEIVDQIAEKHPLEAFRGTSGHPLVTGPMITAAEQRVDLIMEVADWLINEEAK